MRPVKDNLESSIIPRCLCSWTFFTRISLKNMGGWFIGILFLEKATSTACLLGSGLKDIPQLCAKSLIRFRSWFISRAAVWGSWTTAGGWKNVQKLSSKGTAIRYLAVISIALKSWLVNTFAHNQILLDVSANRRLRIHQQTAFEAKWWIRSLLLAETSRRIWLWANVLTNQDLSAMLQLSLPRCYSKNCTECCEMVSKLGLF